MTCNCKNPSQTATANFELLTRVLLVALPDLPSKAEFQARRLLGTLNAIIAQQRRPMTPAKARFQNRAHRWSPTVVGSPNPAFVERGQPFASEWTAPILRALSSGSAHIQDIRQRINTASPHRAMTWVYGWVLHYLWSKDLVVATWRYRLTTWELTDLGRARLAELDGPSGVG